MKIFQRRQTLYLYLLIFFTLFWTNLLYAEAIRLTSGQILEGKILEESDKIIILQTPKGTFTIKKSDIMEMERTDSSEKIAKLPIDPKPSVAKVLLMSFIPGYSPIYYSKEHPEFGIPFAMLSLNYFARFLQFQTMSVRVGFLDSVDSKTPGGLYMNLIYGPRLVGQDVYGVINMPTNHPEYANASFIYNNLRTGVYNFSRDRMVGGQTMTEDEYFNIKRNHLTNYLIVSTMNAAISYYMLKNENGLGAFYKSNHNGVKTLFYALPTVEGGVFATVSVF